MRRIDKTEACKEWIAFIDKHRPDCYDKIHNYRDGAEIIRRLRQHLLMEQKGICAYCCRKIDIDSSLNEHILPRHGIVKGVDYNKRSLEYGNIVATCRDSATCSGAKKNRYSEMFVSPLSVELERHFAFTPDGSIIGLTDEGKYTIDLLNINSYELRAQRRAVLTNCRAYPGRDMILQHYLYDADGSLNAFADVIEYYCKHAELG